MSRLYQFSLLALAAISYTGLSVSPPVAADEPRLEKDWFAGPWDLDYQALVLLPDEPKLKTNQGTEFSDYVLSFTAQARFIVEKDRVVTVLDPTASLKKEPANEKGGKVIFEQRGARFFQRAQWKTPAGAASDYSFSAAGALQGNGQFAAKALELNLEWTTLDGRGTSGGQRISKPVGVHTWKSKWTLKPETPAKSDLVGVTSPKLVLAATRSTPMPQQLAGCPPLPLLERVSIVRAPTADLEVTAKSDPDPGVLGGKCALTVTIKNLGPDRCSSCELNVSLPPGILVTRPKDAKTVSGGYTTLLFPLDNLAKDAVTTIKIEYVQAGKPPPNQKEVSVAAVATVTSRAYDPNPVNNSHIELTTFREKKK